MARFGPLRRPLRAIRSFLPPLNFITIHYGYFIATILLSAVILWGSSTSARSVTFVDALFLTTSAMTLAGLNTINLSTLNTFQQIMLFALLLLGSAIFVSAFVVQVRRSAFEEEFKIVAERKKKRKLGRGRSTSRRRTLSLIRRNRDAETGKDEDVTGTVVDEPITAPVLSGDTGRDSTPPARRGAPEMNGISSVTGEAIKDAEREDPEPHTSSVRTGITFHEDTRFNLQSATSVRQPHRTSFLSMQGVGARPGASLEPSNFDHFEMTSPDFASTDTAFALPGQRDVSRYFDSDRGWISRNSEFHGLDDKDRHQLGGYEYRAVSLLAWLVPLYFVMWQLLGCLGCGAWIANNQPDTALSNGLNPWWVGAFNAVSAFNNSGMSLLDANMTAFQQSYYLLLTMGLLILAGNTCYPIFLRLIVWCMYKVVSRLPGKGWEERAKTLRFLLDHPRRCYTNLFPAQHTWWLLLSVITLNSIDWAGFEILNISNELLDSQLPTNIRVIDGLFQAFAVRSGGFYVVPIPNVRISLQILYVVMMYISVYPVVITMRNSNVYEERSLGIYAEDAERDLNLGNTTAGEKGGSAGGTEQSPSFLRRATSFAERAVQRGSNTHFVRQQLRAQLAHDAWLIALALFLIMIIENDRFVEQPAVFSVFNFLFEIVSGYGCVGMSVGVPWDAYSFCGSWRVLSKLILCVVMLRGRHRGLPVAIDKAVLLPGEEGWRAEEDDGRIRLARTISRGRQENV